MVAARDVGRKHLIHASPQNVAERIGVGRPAAFGLHDDARFRDQVDIIRKGLNDGSVARFHALRVSLRCLALRDVLKCDGQPVIRRVGIHLYPQIERCVKSFKANADGFLDGAPELALEHGSNRFRKRIPDDAARELVGRSLQYSFGDGVHVREPPVRVNGENGDGEAFQYMLVPPRRFDHEDTLATSRRKRTDVLRPNGRI